MTRNKDNQATEVVAQVAEYGDLLDALVAMAGDNAHAVYYLTQARTAFEVGGESPDAESEEAEA